MNRFPPSFLSAVTPRPRSRDATDIFHADLAAWYRSGSHDAMNNILDLIVAEKLPIDFELLEPWPWAYDVMIRLDKKREVEYFLEWLILKVSVSGKELGQQLLVVFEIYEMRYITSSYGDPLHLVLYSVLRTYDMVAWLYLDNLLGTKARTIKQKVRRYCESVARRNKEENVNSPSAETKSEAEEE